MFKAKPAQTILLLTGPNILAQSALPREHYTAVIVGSGSNSHDAILVPMPGTYFTIGWTCDHFVPIPKVGLKMQPLRYHFFFLTNLVFWQLSYRGTKGDM